MSKNDHDVYGVQPNGRPLTQFDLQRQRDEERIAKFLGAPNPAPVSDKGDDLARSIVRVLVEHTSSVADEAWVSLDRLIEADRARVRGETIEECAKEAESIRPYGTIPDRIRKLR